MSWFKKQTSRSSPGGGSPAPGGSPNTSAPSPKQAQNNHSQVAKMVARPRSGTDPDTCLEVFRSHWLQGVTIMNKANMATPGSRRAHQQEDVDTVTQHIDHMMLLLVEEQGDAHGQGPILQFMLSEDTLEKILTWSSRTGELVDKLRLHHLKTYDMLISQAQQPLLIHKPIMRPLLKLLSACAEHPNKVIEKHLILLLHQLCVSVTQNTQLLELLFNASSEQGPAKFLMFSLLIPYVHREGGIGQQARDALLLIMALSARHHNIGRYIAENSDFCPVLATGLSGLYSSLPRKLNVPPDDWYRLTEEDVAATPDLTMFLNSLEFCNAVVQVAHPLVADQLLTFIYNGFLVPVIGPALHQNEIVLNEPRDSSSSSESEESDPDSDYSLDALSSDDDIIDGNPSDILKLPSSLVQSYFGNSMEEVIAATAYLELFIRRITEPALICTFLRFILTARHDDIFILDSLIQRISSNARLCMVSLSLFLTLVDLNCEDVMFQLVFKYLIPCTHVMVSQRRSVTDLDLYSKTAEKFLSLTPACCVPDLSDTPPDGGATPILADSASSGSSSSKDAAGSPSSIDKSRSKTKTGLSFRGFRKSPVSSARSSSPDTTATGPLPPGTLGSKLEHYETSYMEYLEACHEKIYGCSRSCLCWSAPYNGENPPPNALLVDQGIDGDCTGMETEPSSTAATPSASKTIESVFVEAQRQLSADLGPAAESVLPVVGVGNLRGGVRENARTSMVDVSASTDSGCSSTGTNDSPKAGGSGVSTTRNVSGVEEVRLTPLPQDCCADSVTSEADSALSGSSSTVTDPTPADHLPSSPSRSDSPLNDNFDNNDFNTFLLSLKRVKTPVEFCDNIEDSITEIDALINHLRTTSPRLAAKSSTSTVPPSSAVTTDNTPVGRFSRSDSVLSDTSTPLSTSTPNPSKPHPPSDIFPPLRSRSSTDRSGTSTDGLSEYSGDDTVVGNNDTRGLQHQPVVPHATLVYSPLRSHNPGGPQMRGGFNTTKYTLGTPNIGPFLSALLSKLETMMANTLYVNLLLTGVIARLACYPQPLLRSFLLNHSLVFQPTVKSLVQVLGSVKHKVDCYSYTVKDFESLLLRARRFLAWREEQFYHSQDDRGRPRAATDVNTHAPGHARPRGGTVSEPPRAEKKKSSMFGDLLFRRSPLGNKKPAGRDPRLQILSDGKGIRYINKTVGEVATNDKMESVKTKNAVYCALVLEEFLKELAAISQEHAVLSLEGGASLLRS